MALTQHLAIAYLTEAGIEVDHRDPQTLDDVKSQVATRR